MTAQDIDPLARSGPGADSIIATIAHLSSANTGGNHHD
jgi:hypothetical protein